MNYNKNLKSDLLFVNIDSNVTISNYFIFKYNEQVIIIICNVSESCKNDIFFFL